MTQPAPAATAVRRTGADIAAGLALILIPVLTTVMKFVAPGWMLLVYFTVLWAMLAFYVLVIVIAATGFLSPRAAFAFTPKGRTRGRIAAWLHPLAFLLATTVLIDGGDDGTWTSPIAVVLGLPSNSAFAEVANVAFVPLVIVSGAALVWLVVEWILALRARRAARALAAV